jgi:glycosyltransferase involved in cell wall biosynthesis
LSQPEISLVIPVFNEEDNLPVLAAEIAAALQPLGRPYEVLFVDDGSTDGSPAVLHRLAAGDPAVRILRQQRNAGQSAALDVGFRFSRGEVVVTLDADLQNDPADIPKLLEFLDRYDVVAGVRVTRRDDWVRRMSSRIANSVRNRLTHESITDVGCTLKAFRTEYLRRIPMFTGMHRFLPTLLRLEGARITEVPVNHRPRLHGQPKYNIRNRIWQALADLFAVRWMQSRWIDRRLTREIDSWSAESLEISGPPKGSALADGRLIRQAAQVSQP